MNVYGQMHAVTIEEEVLLIWTVMPPSSHTYMPITFTISRYNYTAL